MAPTIGTTPTGPIRTPPATATDDYVARDLKAYIDGGGFQPVRAPSAAELTGVPQLRIGKTETKADPLVAGGKAVIFYDPLRSKVGSSHSGNPTWSVNAHITFQPSGKSVVAPAIGFAHTFGAVHGEGKSAPILVDIPAGTSGMVVNFVQKGLADNPSRHEDQVEFQVRPRTDISISRTEATYRGAVVDVDRAYARDNLGVTLEVTDSKLRGIRGLDGFDGMERPFVRVPVTTGVGNIVWEERPMIYQRSTFGVDRYWLPAVPDEAAARQYGVAVGMDTEGANGPVRLWVQREDQNYFPRR